MCVEDFSGRVCWGLQRVEVKIPPDVRVSPRAAFIKPCYISVINSYVIKTNPCHISVINNANNGFARVSLFRALNVLRRHGATSINNADNGFACGCQRTWGRRFLRT